MGTKLSPDFHFPNRARSNGIEGLICDSKLQTNEIDHGELEGKLENRRGHSFLQVKQLNIGGKAEH